MGDAYIKPDIAAPGASITAAQAAGTGPEGSSYTTKTGTSMATPHVTGSVALIAQQHPDWGPEQLKAALTSTAKPVDALSVFRVGAGRVDVDRATRQRCTSTMACWTWATSPGRTTRPRCTRPGR